MWEAQHAGLSPGLGYAPLLACWLLEELLFSNALTMTDRHWASHPPRLSGSPAKSHLSSAPLNCPDSPPGRPFLPFSSLWGGSLTHLSEVGLQSEGERSRQRGCCNWFSGFPEDLPCTWRDTSLRSDMGTRREERVPEGTPVT